jgi:hypothetical protein
MRRQAFPYNWGASASAFGWNRADQFIGAWKAAGFRLVGHLVWVKSYSSSSGLLAYQHERAYLLAKGNPKRPAKPLPDVLDWRYTGNRLHPTQKPVPSITSDHESPFPLHSFSLRLRERYSADYRVSRNSPGPPSPVGGMAGHARTAAP